MIKITQLFQLNSTHFNYYIWYFFHWLDDMIDTGIMIMFWGYQIACSLVEKLEQSLGVNLTAIKVC